jgi:septal ring factor EnvC (AmiA/AmiB activator)
VRAFPALLLALALLPGIGRADAQSDAQTAAQNALSAHRQAEALARARAREDSTRAALLAEQQVEAAAALRRLEDQTSADTEQLANLQQAQQTASQRLGTAEAALEKLLPVMQRLSAQPAATLLAAPQSPQDAVRGIAVMQGIAAAITAQAQDVQQQSAQVVTLLSQAQAAQTRLAAAAAAQQAAEQQLSTQIDSAKAAEMADADTAAREAEASLAAQRKLNSIAATIASLATTSPLTTPAPNVANLPLGHGGAPVAGHILQAFGADTLAGPAEGVSYSAAPGARVVTPCAGTAIFAGPLQSYGLVVIADCGGGSTVVLAGMHHLDVATGERLAHGQPVGAMLGYDPTDPTRQPVLYVELRQNGNPVDPAAWLAGRSSG